MFKELNEKTYYVGGCVRDELMNIAPHDIDYVIENTTPEKYERIFPDHKKVGVSFPVYIHTELDSEIALARTERSTSDEGNYHDFEVETNVSIEDDLSRRDFTINSIAKHYVSGKYVDPFNGISDIRNKFLRCVNKEAFIEDAIRIYRGARFVARYDLCIEQKTYELMKANRHILSSVTVERVHLELKKVYAESKTPSLFFTFLKTIDTLGIHFDVLDKLSDEDFNESLKAFDKAKSFDFSFKVALASLFHKSTSRILDSFVNKHRFTSEEASLIINFPNHIKTFENLLDLSSLEVVQFYKKVRNNLDNFVDAYDSIDYVTFAKASILHRVKEVFENTKIDIPKSVLNAGNKAIITFVENKYTNSYKELYD